MFFKRKHEAKHYVNKPCCRRRGNEQYMKFHPYADPSFVTYAPRALAPKETKEGLKFWLSLMLRWDVCC